MIPGPNTKHSRTVADRGMSTILIVVVVGGGGVVVSPGSARSPLPLPSAKTKRCRNLICIHLSLIFPFQGNESEIRDAMHGKKNDWVRCVYDCNRDAG